MSGMRAVAVAAIMAGLTAVGSGQTNTTSIALELPGGGAGPIKLSIEAPVGTTSEALTGARVKLTKLPDFSLEVAETLGIPLGTAFSRLRAARQRLDRALKRRRAKEASA